MLDVVLETLVGEAAGFTNHDYDILPQPGRRGETSWREEATLLRVKLDESESWNVLPGLDVE